MKPIEVVKKLNESSAIEKYWDATEIKRDGFMALLKFNFGYDSRGNNYLVTIDNNEVCRFVGSSDEYAIGEFEKIKKEKESGLVDYDFNNSYGKIVESEEDGVTDNSKVVADALDYIENKYNELGSDDKYFLLQKLKKGSNPDRQIQGALHYMQAEYNEIGTDDFHFLYNILSKAKIHKSERPKKKVEPKKSVPKGPTKKEQILTDFRNNLDNCDVLRCTGGESACIRFVPKGSNVGIKAYMRAGKDGDDFLLCFNNFTAKKFIDKLDPLTDIAVDSHKEKGGNTYGDYLFYKFKVSDIPKMSKAITDIFKDGGSESETN